MNPDLPQQLDITKADFVLIEVDQRPTALYMHVDGQRPIRIWKVKKIRATLKEVTL